MACTATPPARSTPVVATGTPPTGQFAPAPVVITFAASEADAPQFAPLVAQFNASTPDMQVQLVRREPGLSPRQLAALADTAAVPFLEPDAISAGLVQDLAPLIDADPAFDRADYFSAALPSPGTPLWLLPQRLAVPVLHYQATRWAAQGLADPPATWRWADLLAAATALTERRGATIQTYGLLDWSGGRDTLRAVLATGGVEAAVPLSDPRNAAALRQVADLAATGVISIPLSYQGRPVMSSDLQPQISAGRVAIWPAELTPGPDLPPLTVPLGTAVVPGARPVAAGGYILSRGSQQPQRAWRWLAFVSRQAVAPANDLPAQPGLVPARQSTALQIGFWNGVAATTSTRLRAVLAGPPATAPDPAFAVTVIEPLTTALQAVLAGSQTLEEALATVQQVALAPTPGVAASPTPAPVVVASPAPTPAPDVTTIVFNAWALDDPRVAGVAQQFMRDHPEIVVDVRSEVPERTWISPFSLAASADCFAWIGPPVPATLTATLDLQPLIDADPAFPHTDLVPHLLAAFQQDRATYGLPQGFTPPALAYSTSAFDRANLAYPDATWTRADLVRAAYQLTGRAGGQPTYGLALVDAGDVDVFLRLYGAQRLRGRGDTTRPDYTSAELRTALEAFVALARDTSPHRRLLGYGPHNQTQDEALTQLRATGQVGMWVSIGTPELRDPQTGRIRPVENAQLAPLPLGKQALLARNLSLTGLYIAAQTPHAAACWQWISYLNGSAVGLRGGFPARASVAQSTAFRGGQPAEWLTIYDAYLPALQRAPTVDEQIPDWGRVYPDDFWFYRAVDRALHGKDLDQELQLAQTLTEQYLACARSGGERAACAKQVDPEYQGWARP